MSGGEAVAISLRVALPGQEPRLMSRIQLPEFFRERLQGSGFDGPVNVAIDRCSEFYGDPTRGLPLFPEYTDHGVSHVQRVLDATAGLPTLQASAYLTAEDVAVITVAVLLHDAAMHLTPEGFLTLIDPGGLGPVVTALDGRAWAEEWNDYLSQASRWDGRQLQSVLGAVSPTCERVSGDLAQFVRSPLEMGSPDRWSVTYCKFVGEFVRRHHPRLAHEFAIRGIPGPTGSEGFRLIELDKGLNDLAGLVARSHGMRLRDTFDYLQAKYYGVALCRNSHPVFLMVLLRIADYLQVESDRAPATSLRVRSLRNPISIREWSVHRSIQEVRLDEFDQEAIVVVARPDDVGTYLHTRSLLDGLQRELDTSWAVLGEIYSRLDHLRGIGIRLRRVKSNLDDLRRLRQELDYIPGRFAFESAGTGLLKKLVMPLYGEAPEVGVRELLQNAIDAVNERKARQRADCHSGLVADLGSPEISVRLTGSPEHGGWLTIEDQGVGMNEEVLRSYYLRAGASFRDSDAWRATFVSGGKPRVIRSGRFGVGALASFLLGERVEVCTRHLTAGSTEALSFAASIDDEAIEVRKSQRDHPGTTVRVSIDGATFARLAQHEGQEWDWYRWKTPGVERTINGACVPSLTRIPEPESDLDLEWHRLQDTDFDEVVWSYGKAPNAVCNGLNVGSLASSLGYHVQLHWEGESDRFDPTIVLKVPSVSVTDRSARFPLDLQRFRIVKHRYPFADQLLADATRDFCAFCLTFATDLPPWMGDGKAFSWPDYPGWTDFIGQMSLRMRLWFYTAEGSGPAHLANLAIYRPPSVMFLLARDPACPNAIPPNRPEQAIFLGFNNPFFVAHGLPIALSYIFGRDVKSLGPHMLFFNRSDGVTALIHSELAASLEGFRNEQIDLSRIQTTTLSARDGSKFEGPPIAVWLDGTAPELPLDLPEKLVEAVAKDELIFALLDRPRVDWKPRESAFSRTWREIMPDPVIPYNLDLRRQLFADAYKNLAKYIKKWEQLKELGPAEFRRRFHKKTLYSERL